MVKACIAVLVCLGMTVVVIGAVPTQMAHQGVVAVNGNRFTGNGTFYFALVGNGGAGNNLWTNDGTELGTTNRPTAGVSISVADGVYSANLGGGTMVPVQTSVFNNANVVLRIWFDDATNTVQLLTPDQRLASVAYAFTAENGVPTGTIMAYGGPNAPPGWLVCDGATVSRTQYSELYAVIGNRSGHGDGATTFHLPDLRGRFLRGVNSPVGSPGSGQDPDAGSRYQQNPGGATGDNVGSLQDDAFRSHSHPPQAAPHFLVINGAGAQGLPGGTGPEQYEGRTTSGAAGGNETRPKNSYVLWIIKY